MAKARVGGRLKLVLRRKGLTVVGAARKIGCSRLTIYNWLAGGGVSPAYRERVERFIANLEK